MYILDANAFISPSNMWYGLDFCPAYWNWLVQAEKEGLLMSIEDIKEEIDRGNAKGQKELINWCQKNNRLFKCETYIPSHFSTVSDWARDLSRPYTASEITTFITKPDSFLITEALARGGTVVTYERSAPKSQENIKIPDVCAGLGIECIKPHEMLRRERARFIL